MLLCAMNPDRNHEGHRKDGRKGGNLPGGTIIEKFLNVYRGRRRQSQTPIPRRTDSAGSAGPSGQALPSGTSGQSDTEGTSGTMGRTGAMGQSGRARLFEATGERSRPVERTDAAERLFPPEVSRFSDTATPWGSAGPSGRPVSSAGPIGGRRPSLRRQLQSLSHLGQSSERLESERQYGLAGSRSTKDVPKQANKGRAEFARSRKRVKGRFVKNDAEGGGQQQQQQRQGGEERGQKEREEEEDITTYDEERSSSGYQGHRRYTSSEDELQPPPQKRALTMPPLDTESYSRYRR